MEVVKEFYRCIDDNQTDKISQIISPKFIDHDAKIPQKGLEELQALIVALHEGFSDLSHKKHSSIRKKYCTVRTRPFQNC